MVKKTVTYTMSEGTINLLGSVKNKSQYIENLIKKDLLNQINPEKVFEEVKKIDDEISILLQQKINIIHKIEPILRDKNLQKMKEINQIKQMKLDIKAKENKYNQKVSKIVGINELLKPAIEGKEFDFKKALGECWGMQGWFGELNEQMLKEYVRRKSK